MLDYKFFRVHESNLESWERLYAPLNVAGELEKMQHWLEANPKRRKKNYQRFVINWLNRTHAQVVRAQLESRINANIGSQPKRFVDYSADVAEIQARYPDLK